MLCTAGTNPSPAVDHGRRLNSGMRLLLAGAVALCAVLAGLSTVWRVPQDLDTAQRVQISLRDEQAAVKRLSAALAQKTLGDKTADNNVRHPEPFRALHKTLKASFPTVFDALKLDIVRPA